MTHAAPKRTHPWKRCYSRNMKVKALKQASKKPRKVFVTLEIDTSMPLTQLRKANYWAALCAMNVIQAQANVAK